MNSNENRTEQDKDSPRLSGFRSCMGEHAGDKCPSCGEGILDYDGWINLTCPKCGYQSPRGGFT